MKFCCEMHKLWCLCYRACNLHNISNMAAIENTTAMSSWEMKCKLSLLKEIPIVFYARNRKGFSKGTKPTTRIGSCGSRQLSPFLEDFNDRPWNKKPSLRKKCFKLSVSKWLLQVCFAKHKHILVMTIHFSKLKPICTAEDLHRDCFACTLINCKIKQHSV